MFLRNYYNLLAGCFGASSTGAFGTDSSVKCKATSGTEYSVTGMMPTLIQNEITGNSNVSYYLGSSQTASYNDYSLSTVSGVSVNNHTVSDKAWDSETHTLSWKINLQIVNTTTSEKTINCIEIVNQNTKESSKSFLVYKDVFQSAVTIPASDTVVYAVNMSMQYPTESNGITRNLYNVMAMLSGCPSNKGTVSLAEGNIAVIRNANAVASTSNMYPQDAFPGNWAAGGIWLSTDNTAAQPGNWNATSISGLTLTKLTTTSTYDSTNRVWTTELTFSAMNKTASSVTANSVVGIMQTITAVIYRGVFATPLVLASGETKKFTLSVSFQMPSAQGV